MDDEKKLPLLLSIALNGITFQRTWRIHAAADAATLSFRPRSTLICFVDGFLPMPRIRVALLHSRVTRFTQRPW